MNNRWGNQDNQVIEERYPTEGIVGCLKFLPHRTKNAIKTQANKLRITRISGKGTFVDLTHKKFNKLLVMERGPDYISPKGKKKIQWWCICDCGNKVLAKTDNLKRGQKSCGHCPTITLGKIYNKYVEPFEFVEDYVNPTNGFHFHRVKSICHYKGKGCKGIFVARVVHIKSGATTSCGCLQRERTSKPEGTHTTSLRKRVRKSAKYIKQREDCFERDNYTCQYSGETKIPVNAHHICPEGKIYEEENIETEEQAMNCDRLWNLDNLITIAEKYHLQSNEYPEAFHSIYGTHNCTKEDFEEWMLNDRDT